MIRAWLAAALGLIASLLDWPETRAEPGRMGRIDLLSPRGHVLSPSRICWCTTLDAARIRIVVRDAEGALLVARTEPIVRQQHELRLTARERELLASAREAVVEAAALSPDGELLAQSAPARFAPVSHDMREGW
jgi:hypothetical protein